MSPPSSESENKPKETSVKAGDKQSFAFLTYSSTLKMEATCSSKASIDFQRATRRYIPEDKTPQNK
jgi:hypothetical protein